MGLGVWGCGGFRLSRNPDSNPNPIKLPLPSALVHVPRRLVEVPALGRARGSSFSEARSHAITLAQLRIKTPNRFESLPALLGNTLAIIKNPSRITHRSSQVFGRVSENFSSLAKLGARGNEITPYKTWQKLYEHPAYRILQTPYNKINR